MYQDRRRRVCFRQAGYAVHRWWLGHAPDNAIVISPTAALAGATVPDRSGRLRNVEGIVNGRDLADSGLYEMFLAIDKSGKFKTRGLCAARVAMTLMNHYVGAAAEARYRRRSLASCIAATDRTDKDHFAHTLAKWFDDDAARSSALMKAERLAQAFTRSPKAWAAICVVAQALQQRGKLDRIVIESLCTAAYGGSPEYDCWSPSWPPKPDEVRSGFFPP